jgi:hypothetical protein
MGENEFMLSRQISKDTVISCLNKLTEPLNPQSAFDAEIVKKGLHLFRDGKVFNVNVNDEDITGVVQENGKYEVDIPIDFLDVSFCDCYKSSICEHQLAVLFYLYSLFDSPGQFVAEWRNTVKERKAKPIFLSKRAAAGTRQFEEYSFPDWVSYFEKEYEEFLRSEIRETYYFSSYNKDFETFQNHFYVYFQKIVSTQLPEDTGCALLFHLNAAVTTFYKMLEFIQKTNLAYQTRASLHEPIRELANEMIDISNMLQEITITSRFSEMLKDSKNYYDHLLFVSKDFTYERLWIYRLVWSYLDHTVNLLDDQELQLNKDLAGEKMNARLGKENFVMEYTTALAHFAFLKGEDERAVDLLKTLDHDSVFLYTYWIRDLTEQRSWQRLDEWLPFVREKTGALLMDTGEARFKREIIQYFLHHIQYYAHETNQLEFYEQALGEWLPYSYPYFNQYLIDTNQLQKWTELQLYLGVTIEELDKEWLKQIEKENRQYLLPLYHQQVIKLIEEKNRPSYKRAVRHLRKLRTHYRQLKQLKLWENYISSLESRYKRLRAFQEELRKGKGKLIDD